MLWHGDAAIPDNIDFLAVPGGFSYGDYLRAGAIAGRSPIIEALKKHAAKGTPILGVCNGFQILTETGLLPGALLRNDHQHFRCDNVNLRVENDNTPFTNGYSMNQVIQVPIAHHDGRYVADDSTLQQLRDNQQIAFTYCNAEGQVVDAANPNGSTHNIAGIFNRRKTILGMMPHPERAIDATLPYGTDGVALFTKAIEQIAA